MNSLNKLTYATLFSIISYTASAQDMHIAKINPSELLAMNTHRRRQESSYDVPSIPLLEASSNIVPHQNNGLYSNSLIADILKIQDKYDLHPLSKQMNFSEHHKHNLHHKGHHYSHQAPFSSHHLLSYNRQLTNRINIEFDEVLGSDHGHVGLEYIAITFSIRLR